MIKGAEQYSAAFISCLQSEVTRQIIHLMGYPATRQSHPPEIKRNGQLLGDAHQDENNDRNTCLTKKNQATNNVYNTSYSHFDISELKQQTTANTCLNENTSLVWNL